MGMGHTGRGAHMHMGWAAVSYEGRDMAGAAGARAGMAWAGLPRCALGGVVLCCAVQQNWPVVAALGLNAGRAWLEC